MKVNGRSYFFHLAISFTLFFNVCMLLRGNTWMVLTKAVAERWLVSLVSEPRRENSERGARHVGKRSKRTVHKTKVVLCISLNTMHDNNTSTSIGS